MPMLKFRCLNCSHEFELEEKPSTLRCPKCLSRFVQLLEGKPLKGKSWGAKSFSVPAMKK